MGYRYHGSEKSAEGEWGESVEWYGLGSRTTETAFAHCRYGDADEFMISNRNGRSVGGGNGIHNLALVDDWDIRDNSDLVCYTS